MATKCTVSFSREVSEDTDGDASYLEQDYDDVVDPIERQKYKNYDAARLKALALGDWYFIGLRARATIVITRDTGYSTVYELTSAGLWGIESDSGEDYLQSVYEEECATLRADIEAMANAKFG